MKRFFSCLLVSVLAVTTLLAQPKRELRAAWIATVANIDWPSKAAIGHTELQKKEMLAMLDTLQALHCNVAIFQIRPTADALYYSQLEPMSSWLTGKQGVDNDQPYDPLAFVIQEAHRRCIDVHVWLNPYRVSNGFSLDELASTHLYRQHPEWFLKYGKQWYFNPALDETRAWLNGVVADIVKRYDIDAIHFDDYFYPYKIKGEEFPDEADFQAIPRGFTDKEDWRRNNVNMVMEELQQTIKAIKPWVEFGISPFGVWRNASTDPERGSQTKAGVQNYDDLYADVLLWLDKGWIDYVMPQIYWEIGKKVADYEIIAHWWSHNNYGRNLYTGMYASQLGNKKAAEAWRIPNELCRQIKLNRSIDEIDGCAFFSMAALMDNRQGLNDSLRLNYYRYEALQPINRSLKGGIALQPTACKLKNKTLVWKAAPTTDGLPVAYYVVYAFPQGAEIDCFNNPKYILTRTQETSFELPKVADGITYCVTAVNRYKQESMPCICRP